MSIEQRQTVDLAQPLTFCITASEQIISVWSDENQPHSITICKLTIWNVQIVDRMVS